MKPKNPPQGTTKFPPSKLTLEEYVSWMTLNSDDNTIITPLYGHLDEAESILEQRTKAVASPVETNPM